MKNVVFVVPWAFLRFRSSSSSWHFVILHSEWNAKNLLIAIKFSSPESVILRNVHAQDLHNFSDSGHSAQAMGDRTNRVRVVLTMLYVLTRRACHKTAHS